MRQADPLDLATRRRIYGHIVDHPGRFLREIQRDLDMAMGTLEFNLAELVKHGLVTVSEAENKRFFPARMDASEKRLLGILRQEIPRRIAVELLQKLESTPSRMSEVLGLLPSTLNYHLAKLVEAGVIERRRDGRQSYYRLPDPEPVLRLMIAHRASFLDRIVDGFLGGLEGFHS